MTLSICQNLENFTAQRVNLDVYKLKKSFRNFGHSQDGRQNVTKVYYYYDSKPRNNFTEGHGGKGASLSNV